MTLKAAIVPVTPFQQNCTLLFNEATKKGVVIDPGGDLDRIQEAIDKLGLTIEGIWLTHGHIDHAAGAAELRETLKTTITGPHPADKFLLDGLEAQARQYGFPGVRNVTPDRWLEEGQTATAGGITFDILHCLGIRRARSYSSPPSKASPSSATCCSAVRSGAPIFPTATRKRW